MLFLLFGYFAIWPQKLRFVKKHLAEESETEGLPVFYRQGPLQAAMVRKETDLG